MKNSVNRSIPVSRKVRGYEIKRMPLGAFLEATRLLNELPETVTKTLFPASDNALERLRSLSKDDLQSLALRAFAVLPQEAVRIFSQLSGIPEGDLVDDPDVGLDGLCEMVEAWLEVNGIENFMRAVRTLGQKVRTVMKKSGFNG